MTHPPHDRLLYAHRGACRIYPENTLAAFRRALEEGANALELDVRLTADGQVVVCHDPTGRAQAGVDAEVCRSTWDEVRRWELGQGTPASGPGSAPHRVPLLCEVLESFPATRLNVDVKPADPRAAEATVRVVLEHGAAHRVNLASFHSGVVRRIRQLGYPGTTSLAVPEIVRLLLLPSVALRAFPPGGQALQIPPRHGRLRLDRPALVARAHRLGLRVDYWVVNEPEEARRLLALGADGLVTDDPAALAPVFRESSG